MAHVGVVAAAAAVEAALPAEEAGETGDLFAPLGAAAAELPVGERQVGGELGRGPGRPKGSPNKRTAKLRDYVLARYRHPAEVLAALASMPVERLAADLLCDRIEAATLQVRAATELLPYLESRMPVAVDLGDTRLPILAIGDVHGDVLAAFGIAAPGDRAMSIDVMPDQGVTRGGAAPSHDGPSHAAAKPLNGHDDPPSGR